jgi:hypothetical protein
VCVGGWNGWMKIMDDASQCGWAREERQKNGRNKKKGK